MRIRPLILALVTAAGLPAAADQPSPGSDPGLCEALRTINATRNKIWVTVYDLGKLRHLDYGWVDACTVRVWRSGGYACGSFYYVRAEVKDYQEQKNVSDTTVQWNPQGLNYGSWVVTLRRNGTSDNYFWEHGNTAGCTPAGNTNCCAAGTAPPQGMPVYDAPKYPPQFVPVTFTNSTPFFVKMTVYSTTEPDLKSDCVGPKSAKTWSIFGQWEYRLRAEMHRKGCDDGKPGATHVGAAKTGGDGKAAATLLYDGKSFSWDYWKK
jgi:hypothetical protein